MMSMNIPDVWPLIVIAVTDALNLDWSELSYKRSSLVIKAATFIVAVFFTTLVVRWRQKRRSSSYYLTGLMPNKNHEPGIIFKLVRGFAWGLVFVSLLFLGIALANPVVFITDSMEMVESREVIYVKDVSTSMGFRLQGTDIPRGEITREIIERLIIKRKDKRDRAAYIVFGTNSEIWSGFTTSFESLMFSISMSPIALAPATSELMWPGDFIMKKGQFVESPDSNSTNLHFGLESAIYLFDRQGSPKITEGLKKNPNAKMRSVVIITDGAADVDPEPQFKELRKRKIIPYLIFVDPDRTIEKKLYGENSPQVQLTSRLYVLVRLYGGQYFLARDRQSVDHISEMLDKLQSIKQIKKTNIKEKEVYFIPLAIAFLFAVAAMAVRVLSLFMWRNV